MRNTIHTITYFKVAYIPPFSQKFIKVLRENVVPSMSSSDCDTHQYEIDNIRENLIEGEDIKIDGYDRDIFKLLEMDEVAYIEI